MWKCGCMCHNQREFFVIRRTVVTTKRTQIYSGTNGALDRPLSEEEEKEDGSVKAPGPLLCGICGSSVKWENTKYIKAEDAQYQVRFAVVWWDGTMRRRGEVRIPSRKTTDLAIPFLEAIVKMRKQFSVTEIISIGRIEEKKEE